LKQLNTNRWQWLNPVTNEAIKHGTANPHRIRPGIACRQGRHDEIVASRKTDWVNNFWKVLAHHPETLQRIWSNIKQVMSNGALDPLTKELIYVAVSITNNCGYCIASHTAGAKAKGMTEEQLGELLAVIGLANETNRLAIGYGVPVDDRFLSS